MGRPLRIEYSGAFYHITSRGNERKSIFRTKKDYERFIGYLESATERYGARIHCFCLIPNHYHLLLETPRGNLSGILHHLNTSYTNYFNAKTKRVGHLLQGRYRAILVDRDAYALELSRYIHLNPVRAHLVKDPSYYSWSSYSAYIGRKMAWDWLERDFILGQMSEDRGEAQRRYRKYVERAMREVLKDPLKNTAASTLLGSEEFIEWVKEKWIKGRDTDREIPALSQLFPKPDLSFIMKESESVFGKGTLLSRKVSLYLSRQLSGLGLGEISKFFGRISSSGVCQNTRRLRVLMEGDQKLRKEVAVLRKKLSQ